jgi:hypothetical protein
MIYDQHPPEVENEYSNDWACGRCDGSGVILICPDDMCLGAGECFHGDGEITCPSCKGAG